MTGREWKELTDEQRSRLKPLNFTDDRGRPLPDQMLPTKYLDFESKWSPSGRTIVVTVSNVRSGAVLGEIKWYPAWRQYAFYPSTQKITIWNGDCLTDIQDVIKRLMEARR